MESEKVLLIRKLVSLQKGEELRLMVIGESEFSNKKNDDVAVDYSVLDRPNPEGNMASFAFEHLRFTAEFGENLTSFKDKEGLFHFAYSYEYEQWLQQGAPGLYLDELEAFNESISKNT